MDDKKTEKNLQIQDHERRLQSLTLLVQTYLEMSRNDDETLLGSIFGTPSILANLLRRIVNHCSKLINNEIHE